MKFLIFNIVVLAALGFILYERGDLEGTAAENLVAKAAQVIEKKAEPLLSGAESAEPVVEELPTASMPSSRSLPIADTDRVASAPQSTPETAPSSQPKNEPTAVATASIEAEPLAKADVAPVVVSEPVSPEVEARRAVVLGLDATEGSERDQPAMTAAERSEHLRDLAEEMEFLSIDMIYR